MKIDRSMLNMQDYQRKLTLVKRINERIASIYRLNPHAIELEKYADMIESTLGIEFLRYGVGGKPYIARDLLSISLMNLHSLDKLALQIRPQKEQLQRYRVQAKEANITLSDVLQRDDFFISIRSIQRTYEYLVDSGKYSYGSKDLFPVIRSRANLSDEADFIYIKPYEMRGVPINIVKQRLDELTQRKADKEWTE